MDNTNAGETRLILIIFTIIWVISDFYQIHILDNIDKNNSDIANCKNINTKNKMTLRYLISTDFIIPLIMIILNFIIYYKISSFANTSIPKIKGILFQTIILVVLLAPSLLSFSTVVNKTIIINNKMDKRLKIYNYICTAFKAIMIGMIIFYKNNNFSKFMFSRNIDYSNFLNSLKSNSFI